MRNAKQPSYLTISNDLDILISHNKSQKYVELHIYFLFFRPTLVLGSIDRSLDVSELGLQPLSSSQTVLNGKMIVIGSDLGLKTLCIDSVNTPRYV